MQGRVIYKGIDLGFSIDIPSIFGLYIVPEEVILPDGRIWHVKHPSEFEIVK